MTGNSMDYKSRFSNILYFSSGRKISDDIVGLNEAGVSPAAGKKLPVKQNEEAVKHTSEDTDKAYETNIAVMDEVDRILGKLIGL